MTDQVMVRRFMALESDVAKLKNQLAFLESRSMTTVAVPILPDASGAEAWEFFSIAANTTLTLSQLNKTLYVNCTSASNLVLPDPIENARFHVINVGSATITVKDSAAATVGTVAAGESKSARFPLDSSGAVANPSALTTDA